MTAKLTKKVYARELERLQLELLDLQDVVRQKGLRLAVLMEGRDAAGKGGMIRRMTEHLNPRAYEVVALGAPPSASGGSGTSSATSSDCPGRARSASSTGAGTTAPASSG